MDADSRSLEDSIGCRVKITRKFWALLMAAVTSSVITLFLSSPASAFFVGEPVNVESHSAAHGYNFDN
jgi:uncharacterized YccA/Bax inhibitor family protein